MPKEIKKDDQKNMEVPDNTLVAEIPKEGIKSLFHTLVGRPDSEEIILHRLIKISPDDIFQLKDAIIRKLDNHKVVSISIKIDIAFEDDRIKQFGSWKAFEDFNWISSEVTSEVLIVFDFLVEMPNFKVPQRHTVSVRIMARPNPLRILRSIISEDFDKMDQIQDLKGPIICRVDFINNVLAKELIEVVKEWNKCCKLAFTENKFIKFIRRHPNFLDYLFKYLTLSVMSILAVTILYEITSPIKDSSLLTFGNFKILFSWALLAIVGILLMNEVVKKIFSYAYNAFRNYGKRFLVFELSNGDKEKQKEVIRTDSNNIYKFILGSGFNILLNIIAGVIVYLLLKT